MSEEHEQMLLDAVKKLANAVLNQGQQIEALKARVAELEKRQQYGMTGMFNAPYEG